jgi:hypothetical protein
MAALLTGIPAVLQAGEVMGGPAPAPTGGGSDCECADPGWTLDLAAMYFQLGATDGEGDDADADFGYRAGLRYETAGGLFFDASYFGFGGEGDGDEDVDVTNWDFMVGDTICCGEKLSLAFAAGLRYSEVEWDSEFDVSGIGPVFSIEAERALGGPWSLYAGITQAFVIGDNDEDDYDNHIFSMTQIEAGIQYAFGMGAATDAFIRVGGEAQYYNATDYDEDMGLFGGGVTVGFKF